MRKTNLPVYVFALLAIAGTARAELLLTVDNPNLAGSPGSTVGWDFSLTSNPEQVGLATITPWAIISDAEFDLDTGVYPVGSFTPFINQVLTIIGPDTGNGELNPWSQTFDNALQTGIGSYAIDPFQSPGNGSTGTLVLTYDEFSVSPFDPSFDPTVDTLANGLQVSVPVSVLVISAAPEPDPGMLIGSLMPLLAAWLWRQRGRPNRGRDAF